MRGLARLEDDPVEPVTPEGPRQPNVFSHYPVLNRCQSRIAAAKPVSTHAGADPAGAPGSHRGPRGRARAAAVRLRVRRLSADKRARTNRHPAQTGGTRPGNRTRRARLHPEARSIPVPRSATESIQTRWNIRRTNRRRMPSPAPAFGTRTLRRPLARTSQFPVRFRCAPIDRFPKILRDSPPMPPPGSIVRIPSGSASVGIYSYIFGPLSLAIIPGGAPGSASHGYPSRFGLNCMRT